jgi:hypothetical protein
MKRFARMLPAAFTLVVAAISAAQAGSLASAPLYGGPAQDTATCILRNTGPSRIFIESVSLDSSGLFVLLADVDQCSDRFLEPGSFCLVQDADLPNNRHIACSVEFSGSARKLRGSLDLQDVSHNVLQFIELR